MGLFHFRRLESGKYSHFYEVYVSPAEGRNLTQVTVCFVGAKPTITVEHGQSVDLSALWAADDCAQVITEREFRSQLLRAMQQGMSSKGTGYS